jgi:hypothetical protein
MKREFKFRVIIAVSVMMFTAVFFNEGAKAQVANAAYQIYDANLLAPTNIDYVTLRTGGTTTMGYYALPDPVYHPNYNAGGAWALTAGFVWNWVVAPVMVTAKPGAANYVQISYTATGNYQVTVAEQAPAAMGSCADATPTLMNVTVVAPPVATIPTADPAQACGDQVAMAVAMTFTEAVPVALAGYAFAINETVENIDAGGAVIGAALVDNDAFIDFPTTGKLETPALTGAASPYGYSFNTSALTVQNSLRTRYTYTAIKASDAPGAAANGVISAISEKSDYIAGTILTYAFTDNNIVIIVNPAPVTGPIYYIPNTYAY